MCLCEEAVLYPLVHRDGRGVYVLLVIRLGKAARIVVNDDMFPLIFSSTTGANLTYKPAWHQIWQLRSASRFTQWFRLAISPLTK
jgi:hypothetical protein